ncbi:hypothetical protein Taro_050299 [Colocasia esculenta]|uniref:Uncharacterized protein n=1 Tax=Colocasia esculenta TaxID=4460 RepID=A0A843XDI0_COLES|nr:hypothetical protein [Colocasia esculenta]
MDLQLCVCRCGVGWSPQLFDFFLVERQLDLSSVTARLRGCSCVVLSGLDTGLISKFDSFEVCPGDGTVVTTVVVCGVPEWWHSFGYGWYLYPVWVIVCGGMSYTSLSGVDVELCFVEVKWCDLPLNAFLPFLGTDQLLVSGPVPMCLEFACEAYSLDNVCVVFLDTHTPVFELYVRLREIRQWDSDFPEFVLVSPVARS